MFWGNGKRRKEVKEIVKRLLMVLTVALIVVAMAAMAAPAFAAGPCCGNSHHIITGTGEKFKPGHKH